VIAENVRLGHRALETRLGISVNGFRTPGGSVDGLRSRPDVRAMLRKAGYPWVSSLYPPHPTTQPGEAITESVFRGIVDAQAQAQPFRYDDGLVEVPMSPVSDVTAMRTARWPLSAFLEATERSVRATIEQGWVFDFLAHPSCLVVEDPQFRTIDLIVRLVRESGGQAQFADLAQIAQRAQG
jgi:hypothetical protein